MLTNINNVYLIENIRNLAQFLCYSSKYGLDYFDKFIEAEILSRTLPNLLKLGERDITMQIIQTVSILI